MIDLIRINKNQHMSVHIHYDCDPGQDDAIAFLFALGAGVHFESISVVGGNVDVRQCARNMLQLMELTGHTEIPLYIGAAQPLKRMAMPLPDVFGESGMDGANLPLPKIAAQNENAVDYIVRASLPKTLVATGPLTNLALAMQKAPDFATRFDHLVLMGGCTEPEHIHGRMGNIQPQGSADWAEYNFAVDPEAAKIVFTSGFKRISMIGLNITRSVLHNGALDARLRASGGHIAQVAANILSTVGPEDKVDYASCHAYKGDPVRAVHDVVAMAYLTNPEIFTVEKKPIRIVLDPPPAAAGQSIIDKVTPDHAAVEVITDLDRSAFLDLTLRYISNLS